MELTDDDVLEILKLFEQSKFDFLQLEQGERKITVSKGGYVPATAAVKGAAGAAAAVGAASATVAAAPAVPVSSSAPVQQAAQPARPAAQPTRPAAPPVQPAAPPVQSAAPPAQPVGAADDGLIAITAPMVGKFYSSAAPSDPPYVETGSKVAAGATVGLIEVMKVFTSIKTETSGTIERILVTSGEFVEFGQTLFLIRPE